MSTAVSNAEHAESVIQTGSSRTPSVARLVQRLSAEVDAAQQHVHSLQTEAESIFHGQEDRLMRFIMVADRIHAILLPRLQAFTSVDVFDDITHTVSLESTGPETQGFHGRTTTLTVPRSDTRTTPMAFSFRVGHDGPMKNVVMDYRLEILPVFVQFDSHDQLVVRIDDPNEEAITTWIDDKLVGFTRTYFEVYFHAEYQKNSLVMDPVMNIQFPKAFAVGMRDYQGKTYHLYTEESLQKFAEDPSKYVATPGESLSQRSRARRHSPDASPPAVGHVDRRDEKGT